MELKIMSFNLRTEGRADGINYFPLRTPRILATIETESPDLIGFQEATDTMRSWLTEALFPLGYMVIGCGRSEYYRGEATIVAYKRSIFEMISAETRWLSATPTIPGSNFGGDQSACPRVFTSVILKRHDVKTPFVFVNTHLDHLGTTARLLGAVEICQYLSEKNLPFILTGDMNAEPDAPEIKVFTEHALCGRPVLDATAQIGATFHNYGRLLPDHAVKIDYIFTDMPCDISRSYRVEDIPVEGVYISDHNPVCAYVELN